MLCDLFFKFVNGKSNRVGISISSILQLARKWLYVSPFFSSHIHTYTEEPRERERETHTLAWENSRLQFISILRIFCYALDCVCVQCKNVLDNCQSTNVNINVYSRCIWCQWLVDMVWQNKNKTWNEMSLVCSEELEKEIYIYVCFNAQQALVDCRQML